MVAQKKILKSLTSKLPKSKRSSTTLFVGVFAVVGAAILFAAHAATGSSEFTLSPQNGTVGGSASIVSDNTAISGQTLQFGSGSGGTGTGGTGGTGTGSAPYASALSAYSTLAQSYTASQMISGNWAKNANDSLEGNNICPVGQTTYDSTNDAVKLNTGGGAIQANGTQVDCAHIRSASGVSTNGTVLESRVFLPSSGSNLIDWASYWTDGVPTNGLSWPVTGELDAIETQYGVNYSSVHYGTNNTTLSTTPAGWGAGAATVNNAANNAVPGWNTVDMEFLANWAGANVYINGKLYASFPASSIPHYSAYVNWGVSGPNADDPNHASWPSGAGYEEVQYLKVFTK